MTERLYLKSKRICATFRIKDIKSIKSFEKSDMKNKGDLNSTEPRFIIQKLTTTLFSLNILVQLTH